MIILVPIVKKEHSILQRLHTKIYDIDNNIEKKMNTRVNTPENFKVNLKNWILSIKSKSFKKLLIVSSEKVDHKI